MEERNILAELRNIVNNYPVAPGDTISHSTANECVRRGWARRNGGPIKRRSSWFVPTAEGVRVDADKRVEEGE